MGVDNTHEGSEKAHTSSYKARPGDAMYSMGTAVKDAGCTLEGSQLDLKSPHPKAKP